MAWALHFERPGGRCHVTVGGDERKDRFREDPDPFHSLKQAREASRASWLVDWATRL